MFKIKKAAQFCPKVLGNLIQRTFPVSAVIDFKVSVIASNCQTTSHPFNLLPYPG